MPLNEIFWWALVLTGLIFVIALLWCFRLEKPERDKIITDTLLKASIVFAGVIFSIFSFFVQSTLEESKSRLNDASDALISLDAFISKYDRAVDNIRLDDDDEFGFTDIVKECQTLKSYCDRNVSNSGTLTASDLEDFEAYLTSPYVSSFSESFDLLMEQKPFLKNIVQPSNIVESDDSQSYIEEQFEIIKEELADDAKLLQGTTSKLIGVGMDTRLSALKGSKFSSLGYKICCDVLDIYTHSLLIKQYGDLQHLNFCRVRGQFTSFLNDLSSDYIASTFEGARVKEMRSRLSRIAKKDSAEAQSVCLSDADPPQDDAKVGPR